MVPAKSNLPEFRDPAIEVVLLDGELDVTECPRLRTHNQNSTVAANAMAERKTFGHLS